MTYSVAQEFSTRSQSPKKPRLGVKDNKNGPNALAKRTAGNQ